MNIILLTKFLTTLVVSFNQCSLVYSDVFTSTDHMKKLIDIENALMASFNQYIERQVEQLSYSEK